MIDFDKTLERRGTNSYKWDYGYNELYDNLLPLWVADMDFEAPKEVIDAIKARAKHGIYGYTFRPEGYYKSIIKWFDEIHNVKIKKDWIVPIPGVVPGIAFAIQALTNPGDKIIIQPPVYRPFYEVINNLGRRISLNPLIENNGYYKMDFENLEKIIDNRTTMLILCSPHNPVGRVWKKTELEKLGEICLKHNITVVSDEIHADIVYSPNKHNMFFSVSDKFLNNSIVLTAPNKTFNIAGLQTGNAFIPNKFIRQKFEAVINSQHLNLTNIFGIVATEAAYTYGKSWLNQLKKYLYDNAVYVKKALEKNTNVRTLIPEGTFLMWLDLRKYNTDIHEKLLKNGLWLNQGKEFGKEGDGFERMNIATSRKIIEKAVKIIISSLNDLE
ncbi:aminotransferase, class II [Thermosipho africanus H17ap60334]|jgi:cystathionine beta-lyase|uniref:cysteine-S-conjugate beta-lyase n=1 Tax=Thermosipho africanus (strain TCF52B) TaxID=484019 RepID=B7IDQ9_THEAB|nr:MalY/PatB family protein [Thermosipho africanus]ACJ76136.1 aminotransferase, class II [Thermosipho africanus TCF52B]EKF49276.1 aminotransferase, class II [Thermosipho africanus H17ap60334]MDK2839041.1 cysteine-S-conjugate beta-lyase [Thermosipho sp. (in: thermotogales)]